MEGERCRDGGEPPHKKPRTEEEESAGWHISNSNAVAALFQCSACMEPFSEERAIYSCAAGHMMCAQCRKEMQQKTGCFECRDPNVKPNPKMMEFLGHVTQQCAGCKQPIPMLQVDHHKNFECPEEEIRCSACGECVKRKEMVEHYVHVHRMQQYTTKGDKKLENYRHFANHLEQKLVEISALVGHSNELENQMLGGVSFSVDGIIFILQVMWNSKKVTAGGKTVVEVCRCFQKHMQPPPVDERFCMQVRLKTPEYPLVAFNVPVVPKKVEGKVDYRPWSQICLLEASKDVCLRIEIGLFLDTRWPTKASSA